MGQVSPESADIRKRGVGVGGALAPKKPRCYAGKGTHIRAGVSIPAGTTPLPPPPGCILEPEEGPEVNIPGGLCHAVPSGAGACHAVLEKPGMCGGSYLWCGSPMHPAYKPSANGPRSAGCPIGAPGGTPLTPRPACH